MKKKNKKTGGLSIWLATFFAVMIIIALNSPTGEDGSVNSPDWAVWAALIIPTVVTLACTKKHSKEGKAKIDIKIPSIEVRFVLLLAIDVFVLRTLPKAYTKPSYWIFLFLFLFATALCALSVYVNAYMSKNKLDMVVLNNTMNDSYNIKQYFECRTKLIAHLSKMAKYELLISKGNGLNDKPSNLLKQIDENEDLSVHTAIIRMTTNYKNSVKEDGIDRSDLFAKMMNDYSSRLSAENAEEMARCLHILQEYESVVGTISEADSMEGHDFEYWCADLLKKNGYTDVEVTRGSGDQGVDILAAQDGIRYAIQCKCYSSNLGNSPVQEVSAGKAFYHCQVGAVMTNRYFTAGARELAEANGILLWDRDKLEEMLSASA